MGHSGPGGFYSSVHKIKEHLDFLCCGAEEGQSRGSYRSLSALTALWKHTHTPLQRPGCTKKKVLSLCGKDVKLKKSQETLVSTLQLWMIWMLLWLESKELKDVMWFMTTLMRCQSSSSLLPHAQVPQTNTSSEKSELLQQSHSELTSILCYLFLINSQHWILKTTQEEWKYTTQHSWRNNSVNAK